MITVYIEAVTALGFVPPDVWVKEGKNISLKDGLIRRTSIVSCHSIRISPCKRLLFIDQYLLANFLSLFTFDPFTSKPGSLSKSKLTWQWIKFLWTDQTFIFKRSYRLTEALVVFLRTALILSTSCREIHRIPPVVPLYCSWWAIVRMNYRLRCGLTVCKNSGFLGDICIKHKQDQDGHENKCYKD